MILDVQGSAPKPELRSAAFAARLEVEAAAEEGTKSAPTKALTQSWRILYLQ